MSSDTLQRRKSSLRPEIKLDTKLGEAKIIVERDLKAVAQDDLPGFWGEN